MTNENCGYKLDCVIFSIMASIIVGIVTAIFRYTAIVTITPVFLWVIFGIAVGYILLAFIKPRTCCATVCKKLPLILSIIGALVTVLLSVILLAITFAATSVTGAILYGIALGAFSLTLTAAACYALKTEDCCD